MAYIIDGKALSQKIRLDIKKETEQLKNQYGKIPGLAVIIAGEDPASKVYVKNKILACQEAGFFSVHRQFGADVDAETLIRTIIELNADDNIDGILVQLPLPKPLDGDAILPFIDVRKDVDGLSAFQQGLLLQGTPDLISCTPNGVIELIKSAGKEMSGKNAVVIGRSNMVGKPMAMLLLRENATVTVCHSKTENLKETVKNADIVVAAIGKAKFVTADMIKDGAVVIDVGMNSVDGKLCGDVDFENVKEKASAITPVPGGVGPMTITMLLKNTLQSFKRKVGASL
ncbi:MAG: bifunctional methylenetetrahydrofolate dehydrogenase/methenyltetrahydrofolate cyclohydrolase FolD [Clostridiales bacterium]|jgi:methylenetetrahydrofolate dehydrogenase (NADP+)/methenyltetrahydrofolate cyclohydrolase|nr:bifunctional methylenetetrahydrofolate dehydrogenase/methenyltetrahydrofolate cyclohydrolase FolD [Clostridiales bacterium]